jgi:hypothetical protein
VTKWRVKFFSLFVDGLNGLVYIVRVGLRFGKGANKMVANKIEGLKPMNFIRKNLIEFVECRTGCTLSRHERLA